MDKETIQQWLEPMRIRTVDQINEKPLQTLLAFTLLGFLIGFMFHYNFYNQYPKGMCEFHSGVTGMDLKGDCMWIAQRWKEENPRSDYVYFKDPQQQLTPDMKVETPAASTQDTSHYLLLDKDECPTCEICNNTGICPVVNCPDLKCPTTAVCQPWPELALSRKMNESLLNMRWKNPGGSVAQGAYSKGKYDCLTILGLVKGYNGGPIGTGDTLAASTNWAANNTICFVDVSSDQSRSAFILNTSLWWSNSRGSQATIRLHKHPTYNFSIWHPDDTEVTCWDTLTNTTVDC
jgi:hypothetical protein